MVSLIRCSHCDRHIDPADPGMECGVARYEFDVPCPYGVKVRDRSKEDLYCTVVVGSIVLLIVSLCVTVFVMVYISNVNCTDWANSIGGEQVHRPYIGCMARMPDGTVRVP